MEDQKLRIESTNGDPCYISLELDMEYLHKKTGFTKKGLELRVDTNHVSRPRVIWCTPGENTWGVPVDMLHIQFRRGVFISKNAMLLMYPDYFSPRYLPKRIERVASLYEDTPVKLSFYNITKQDIVKIKKVFRGLENKDWEVTVKQLEDRLDNVTIEYYKVRSSTTWEDNPIYLYVPSYVFIDLSTPVFDVDSYTEEGCIGITMETFIDFYIYEVGGFVEKEDLPRLFEELVGRCPYTFKPESTRIAFIQYLHGTYSMTGDEFLSIVCGLGFEVKEDLSREDVLEQAHDYCRENTDLEIYYGRDYEHFISIEL